MTRHSEAYLAAARSAQALLAEPAVAAAWTRPSALPEMTVGALAAHLAGQVVAAPGVLRADASGVELVPLRAHYERATWTDGDLGSEANAGIRGRAEEQAAAGADAVRGELADAIGALEAALPTERGERPVRVPSGPWALTLDDFLVTRMMEIAVHSDDLAVSVDVPTPDLPLGVLEPVLLLLIGLSVGRHGQAAVLRALARAERAPATINAL
jgi:hypothetical protein